MDKEKCCWPGWETVQLIGRGSFGRVYEIRRTLINGDMEKAALKVLSIPQNESDIDEMRSDGYDDDSITSTFRSHLKSIVSEYSTMRKLSDSTNVVNCDDIIYEPHSDGFGWDVLIKMELLTSVTQVLPSEIPEEMVIRLGVDICKALEQCRKYGIIHRDIKPQNIFISPNGDYKLGDFGIAKTVEKTMGGTKIGTYKYMAPEVYHDQPYNAAADIYSLGLVLYWMLNERRLPFMPTGKLTAGADGEARRRRFAGEPIPAPKHGSNTLKRIVLKACAFDPKDRFASAKEMLDALEQIGQAETVVNDAERQEKPQTLDEKIQSRSQTIPAELDEDKTVGLFPVSKPAVESVQKTEHVNDRYQTPETMTQDDAAQESVIESVQEAEKDLNDGSVAVVKEKPKPENKRKKWPRLLAIAAAAVLLVCLVVNLTGPFWVSTGWAELFGKTYYMRDGVKQTGWQTIDGQKYYFGDDGVMRNGWQTIDGERYYFNSLGMLVD